MGAEVGLPVTLAAKIRRLVEKGPAGVLRALQVRVLRPVHLVRVRRATEYRDPDEHELALIESELRARGMECEDYRVDESMFEDFTSYIRFPPDYHGGQAGGVYVEKLLEHFVAWDLLGLGTHASAWPYVDIAGASSPWAKLLRERGQQAFSIDLAPHRAFAGLSYYIKGDGTRMPFAAGTIGSASLQCAYEMFAGDADTRLVRELARVLKPGGRAVISPLYMHTHACYYQSPEYFGRYMGDEGASAYVRRHSWAIPVSRKYCPDTLRTRVWEPALTAGLMPRLRVLGNKAAFGSGVYLHFILSFDKTQVADQAGGQMAYQGPVAAYSARQ